MTDMLVKLYELPETLPVFSNLVASEIKIRKPIVSEKSLLVQWVRENFGDFWADEMEITFSRLPISCYIAQREKEVLLSFEQIISELLPRQIGSGQTRPKARL